ALAPSRIASLAPTGGGDRDRDGVRLVDRIEAVARDLVEALVRGGAWAPHARHVVALDLGDDLLERVVLRSLLVCAAAVVRGADQAAADRIGDARCILVVVLADRAVPF